MKYRTSRQRELILELLSNNPYHPSAEWIYRRVRESIPRVSLGTVYRNLEVLADQGLAQKVSFGEDRDRFEANTGEHYHFICERCREITDLVMPVDPSLNRRAARFGKRAVKRHRIVFYGICASCRKNMA
ncbi:MAG: transcriptional repressor [Spirochaetales bacterium]|nr:transcriptional repressor [Spirochaetales bacterium]